MKQNPAKRSKMQEIVMDYLDERVHSTRDFHKQTGLAHSSFAKYKAQKSFMGVDKLEHILYTFPELKAKLVAYLRGDTDGNITPETKRTALHETQLYGDALKGILDRDNQIADLKRQLEERGKKGKKRASPPDSPK